MIAWLLLVAVPPEVSAEAHVRRVAGHWEISISGTARGVAVLTLRFRRIAERADWATRRLEARPLDPPWDRAVTIERGAFRHREPLDSPGDVEIEIRPGRPGADETGCVLRRVEAVLSTPDRLSPTRTEATAELLRLHRQDQARLKESPGAAALSSINGAPLTQESQRDLLEEIAAVEARERRLVLGVELKRVMEQMVRLAGDQRRWNRALPMLDRSLQALEAALRAESADELKWLMGQAEMMYHRISEGTPCESEGAFQAARELEERFRGPLQR